MSTWTQLWVVWLLMFAAIEGAALANKKSEDTLSEHVWKWFSIRHKGNGWRMRRFSLLAFLVWLAAHFLSGGKF